MNRGLMRQVKTFPLIQWEEDQLENQSVSKKRHSEESLKELTKLVKDYVRDLYRRLSENIGETLETFHYDYFKQEDGELYYRDKKKLLTYGEGKLKSAKEIKKILCKRGLQNLGFFFRKK